MNVDTGQMGRLADVLRDAQPGERVIPATIIPDPLLENALRLAAAWDRDEALRRFLAAEATKARKTVDTISVKPSLYGPRKPLREVRRELAEAREREATP